MENIKNYRLGLDVGVVSLGWSVLELNDNNEVERVRNAGVRIFSDGRVKKTMSTLAAERRVARGARRRRDRFLQRQSSLITKLTDAGLFPDDKQERKDLQQLNPLMLRAKALSEKLEPHQIGRALFHINQRRGFKSNRKDSSEEVTSGKVAQSVKALVTEMGLITDDESDENSVEWLEKLNNDKKLTLGAFLWQRHLEGKPTRARPNSGEEKLYDVYPTREIYQDEFNKIWEAQAKHHLKIMTPELREEVEEHIIFYQRPLKSPALGYCRYFPKEKRAYRALPSFQRYRIYQDINYLEWRDNSNEKWILRNNRDMRDLVVAMLEKQVHKTKPVNKPALRNAEIEFKQIKNYLRKEGYIEGEITFNFENNSSRKGFEANLTSHIMQHPDYVGAIWHEWELEKQDKFITIILDDDLNDDKVQEKLQNEFGLSPQAAEKCTNAGLADGTADVSEKAARLLLKEMEYGRENNDGEVIPLTQYGAVKELAEKHKEEGFRNPARMSKSQEGDYEPAPKLPYYGEALMDKGHIIPGTGNEKDKKNDLNFHGGVSNPTVHIALNQIRVVVNELIARYGHPHSIAIELGRDLPKGAEYRSGIGKAQEENRGKNQKLGDKLTELGVSDNAANRLRLKLWKEQKEMCPYSDNKRIGCSELFSPDVEVDHIIPFSISLDDSAANKVVCMRQANRYKSERTPWEAFYHNPDGYTWNDIYSRAREITVTEKRYSSRKHKFEETTVNNKLWRFEEDARQRMKTEEMDFLARHLNDNRYIGRLARDYLECICHIDKIDVVTGRVTALLRRHWGLNSILHSDDRDAKNRDDHRHHAVDAIVIGMTNINLLNEVADAASKGRNDQQIESLLPKNKDGTSPIDPWQNFRTEVEDVVNNIRVSHRVNKKKQGQLLLETAYGYADKQQRRKLTEADEDKAERVPLVTRKSIKDFTTQGDIEKIRDKSLREDFLQAFEIAVNMGKKGVEGVLSLAKDKNIRHLRVNVNKTVQPIRDKERRVYKAYELRNNWATEIYQLPSGEQKDIVINRFEASKQGFQPGVSKRSHPAAKLVMRLFNGDMLMITDEQGKERLMRVHKMSKGEIVICEHHIANCTGEEREKELRGKNMLYRMLYRTLSQKLNPRKVHISPTGMLRCAEEKKP